MNICVDENLTERAKTIARNNGISVTKYINNLVESALNGEERLAKELALRDTRLKIIQGLWEEYDFPTDIHVEASASWSCDSYADGTSDYNRTFFYSLEGSTGPTLEGHFLVGFKEKSTKPAFVRAVDNKGCTL